MKKYDYIIVGAGSAGCLLANRLSADPRNEVLVIEAGGSDRNFWLRLPVGYFKTLFDPRFTRNFAVEPVPGLNNRLLKNPKGRVVGGSSAINGLIAIRGQHEDFDDWEKLGAKGWSYRDTLPYFRKFEKYEGLENEYRSKSGELGISNLREHNSACNAWLEAAQSYGLNDNPDFNTKTTLGSGRYQLTLEGRWRASAASSFLKPVLDRPNLTLLTKTHVTRVLFDGDAAIGVEVSRNGQLSKILAQNETILSAGAIQTPQILQLSGIGNPDHLRDLGIEVVHESPNVGENLQDHLQMRSITELKGAGSLNHDIRNPLKLAEMGLKWLFNGTGPLTIGAGQVGGATCTKYAESGRPDVQLFAMPLSLDQPGKPLHKYAGFTTCIWQCHPKSRGYVRIKSNDPFADPSIQPNYLADTHDQKVLVEGLKIMREIHAQPAFRKICKTEIVPGDNNQSDEEILAAIRQHAVTVYHHVGTCRMGDENSVLNSNLEVNGVRNLRVIDASAMPQITSANTNLAVMMIAEKGAAAILKNNG